MIGVDAQELLEKTRKVKADGTRVSADVSGTDLFGERGNVESEGHAFLVDGPSETVLQAHCHTTDQFQIVMAEGLRIGRHDAGFASVHYADAYSPYGPIVAGEDGLRYITLRPSAVCGLHWMPAEAAVIKGRRGRVLLAEPDADGPAVQSLISEPDGVTVSYFSLNAGEDLEIPELKGGGGFFVVVSGHAISGSSLYGPLTCLWVDPDEGQSEISAGEDGCSALLLEFARPAIAA